MAKSEEWREHGIPIDARGNMLDIPFSIWRSRPAKSLVTPAASFSTTLQIVGIVRYRLRQNRILLQDTLGRRYYMFLDDLIDLLANCVVYNGEVSGSWDYVKRYDYYGIKKIKEV
jgi:hypothetical protein